MWPENKRIIVVADDLTGASDASLPFAEAGIPSEICLNTQHLPTSGAVALVTDTRQSSASETEARNFEVVGRVHADHSDTIIYQKIDSTLRGHPAGALAGTMRALAVERALVAPAYPDQGRTTIAGQQLVFGQPLEESAFRHEVHSGDIRLMLRQLFPAVASIPTGMDAIDLRATQVYVADAETDDDLDKLIVAALSRRMPLYCGSAGLAKALAKALASGQSPELPDVVRPSSKTILAVIGSRHPTSRRQIDFAAAQGIAVVKLAASELTDTRETIADRLCAELSQAGALILTTPDLELRFEPQTVAALLAAVVRAVLQRCGARELVLSGGDTAHAVAKAIGASRIRLQGAIEPGIALGRWRDGLARNHVVVTKAGGFGTETSLHRIIKSCHSNPSAAPQSQL